MGTPAAVSIIFDAHSRDDELRSYSRPMSLTVLSSIFNKSPQAPSFQEVDILKSFQDIPGPNNRFIKNFGKNDAQDTLVLKTLVQLSRESDPRIQGNALDCLAELGMRRVNFIGSLEGFRSFATDVAAKVLVFDHTQNHYLVNLSALLELTPFELTMLLDQFMTMKILDGSNRTTIIQFLRSLEELAPSKAESLGKLYMQTAHDPEVGNFMGRLKEHAQAMLKSVHTHPVNELQRSDRDDLVGSKLSGMEPGTVLRLSEETPQKDIGLEPLREKSAPRKPPSLLQRLLRFGTAQTQEQKPSFWSKMRALFK